MNKRIISPQYRQAACQAGCSPGSRWCPCWRRRRRRRPRPPRRPRPARRARRTRRTRRTRRILRIRRTSRPRRSRLRAVSYSHIRFTRLQNFRPHETIEMFLLIWNKKERKRLFMTLRIIVWQKLLGRYLKAVAYCLVTFQFGQEVSDNDIHERTIWVLFHLFELIEVE